MDGGPIDLIELLRRSCASAIEPASDEVAKKFRQLLAAS